MSETNTTRESTDESHAIIIEESRRVLDHQIDSINAVEDKAAWTLRVDVLLLSVLIAAVGRFGVAGINGFSLVGVLLVVLSLVVGIVTYGVSDVDVGSAPGTVERNVPHDHTPSDVYDALLAIHEDSIAFNRGTLSANERLLTLTQALLVAGVSFVTTGFLASM